VPTVRVPEQHREALIALRDISEEDFDRLVSTLSEAPTFMSLPALLERVARGAPAPLKNDADRVVQALLSLRSQLKFWSWPAERLARGVANSEGLSDADESTRERFAARLEQLLHLEPLATTADAADALSQHDHPYFASRIFTDIRPVFSEDPTEPPTGAVIVNVLKLEYLADRAINSFYVALDESDLESLGTIVERAKKKTETVKSFLGAAGVSHYEIDEDGEAGP
jgi:hypothetical protein